MSVCWCFVYEKCVFIRKSVSSYKIGAERKWCFLCTQICGRMRFLMKNAVDCWCLNVEWGALPIRGPYPSKASQTPRKHLPLGVEWRSSTRGILRTFLVVLSRRGRQKLIPRIWIWALVLLHPRVLRRHSTWFSKVCVSALQPRKLDKKWTGNVPRL